MNTARDVAHLHHRRSMRLHDWDYASAGVYFITICAQNRDGVFGAVVDGDVRLNEYGRIAWACWQEIPAHFPHAELDAFVVMPNHVHGIVWIVTPPVGATDAPPRQSPATVGARHAPPRQSPATVGARHASPLHPPPSPPRGPGRGSLGAIVGAFKSAVTKRINEARCTPGDPVWQRNYYEHIVRDEAELGRIREYILNNPANWATDESHPSPLDLPERKERCQP